MERKDLHESESTTERVGLTDPSAEDWDRSPVAELPRAISEALSDTIVQALIAADGISRESIEELMRRVSANIARPVVGSE
jgi:hypothetical protein